MAETYNLNCPIIIETIKYACKELFNDDAPIITPDVLPTHEAKCAIKIRTDNKDLLLNIFFKPKGQSFNVQGKNQDLTERIKDEIIKRCSLSEKETSLTIRNFPKENFNNLLESFQNESVGQQSFEDKTICKLLGKYKAETTITYYKNGTLFIQGRPSLLFNEIRYFLCDKTRFKDLIDSECQKEYISISTNLVDVEYNNFFGSVTLPKEVGDFIRDSITINKCEMPNLNDKTLFITPICKALEYVLTLAIENNTGEFVDKRDGFYEFFGLNMEKYQFNSKFYKDKINENTAIYLEKAYDYYASVRNAYFHARPHELKIIEVSSEVKLLVSEIGTCIFDIANNLL